MVAPFLIYPTAPVKIARESRRSPRTLQGDKQDESRAEKIGPYRHGRLYYRSGGRVGNQCVSHTGIIPGSDCSTGWEGLAPLDRRCEGRAAYLELALRKKAGLATLDQHLADMAIRAKVVQVFSP
jgi:hypothetical protein